MTIGASLLVYLFNSINVTFRDIDGDGLQECDAY